MCEVWGPKYFPLANSACWAASTVQFTAYVSRFGSARSRCGRSEVGFGGAGGAGDGAGAVASVVVGPGGGGPSPVPSVYHVSLERLCQRSMSLAAHLPPVQNTVLDPSATFGPPCHDVARVCRVVEAPYDANTLANVPCGVWFWLALFRVLHVDFVAGNWVLGGSVVVAPPFGHGEARPSLSVTLNGP